mgnify:CR=1 FL=1
MALKIGKDTAETWRMRFYAYTAGDPGDTIEMLLRGAANIADETVDESTPMDVVLIACTAISIVVIGSIPIWLV